MRPRLPDPSVPPIDPTLLQHCDLVIDSLDLTLVKMKIMEPDPEGRGWTKAMADEAEIWYKRYLKLCFLYPELPVVPNGPIDMMWHQHILDTQAYGADCQRIFGHMLHHYPYYGLNGDAAERDDSFDVTNDLYQKHFGQTCKHMTTFIAKGVKRRAGAASCSGKTCCGQQAPNALTETNNREEVGVGCGRGPGDCRQGCKREPVASFDDSFALAMGTPAEPYVTSAANGQNCCGKGGGTGCRQGCRRGSNEVYVSAVAQHSF